MLEEVPISVAAAHERRLYIGRDPNNIDYFLCNRSNATFASNCANFEEFYEIKDDRTVYVDKAYQCDGALDKAITEYVPHAVSQCKQYAQVQVVWRDCRDQYCDMYEKLVQAVTNGTQYYLGSECADMLTFNRSICGAYYRDAWAFCDCACPGLLFLEATDSCQIAIMAYMLFGKMGHPLLTRFPMTALCSNYFCKWLEKIADPRNQVKGAPAKCLGYALPFVRGQCEKLLERSRLEPVYDPCPWDKPDLRDFIMTCSDGSFCDVRAESWACCNRHGQRLNCPKNFPVMCSDPLECVGGSDHCCVEDVSLCESGPRECSPLMAPRERMIEWSGMIPPNGPEYVAPTTTMSMAEYEAWLSRLPKPTTEPESWGDEFMPYWPFVAIPIVIICFCMALVAWVIFGTETVLLFGKTVFGSRRYLTIYRTDVVHKFAPSDPEREWDDLPPRVTQEDIERMRANEAACKALADACRAAFAYGRVGLVSVEFRYGRGPVKEANDLEDAIAVVKARSLHEDGENPRLIEEGEAWIKTLRMESLIVEAMMTASPCLTIDFKTLAPAPIPGAPWAGTVVGHAVHCDKRREVWSQIEDLSVAIKTSKDGGISSGLLDLAQDLLNGLIARTPELPADRVVLDPGGHGVKLLPKGKQRGQWVHTGDAYLYDTASQKAGEINNFDLPPDEQLRNTSVDPGRPVCASYAQTGKCKAGKRCPWRHATPVEGDVIRESIIW